MFLAKAETDVGRSMRRIAVLKSFNIYSWMPLVQRQAPISSLAVAAERYRSIRHACINNGKMRSWGMRSRRLKHRTAKKYHEANSCNSCNAGIWNSGPFFGRYPYLNHKLMGVGQLRVLCFQGQKLQPDTKSLNSGLYKWSGAQIQSFLKPLKT